MKPLQYISSRCHVLVAVLSCSMLVLCGSCSIDIAPADQYSAPAAITTVAAGRSMLSSVYASYPHYELQLSLLADDYCPTSLQGQDATLARFYNWDENAISDFSETAWQAYYSTIASCNTLLERAGGIQTANESEQQEKSYIVAEATALKAMGYFDLLRLFAPAYPAGADSAGIPLKEHLALEYLGRSSVRACTDTIVSLLTRAAAVTHDTKSNGWLSQTACRYLLAEVCLYKGDWAQAAALARQVIDAGGDGRFTASAYTQLWSTGQSAQRIFAFNTDQTYYTEVLANPVTDGDLYMLNPQLTYADGDIRRTLNVNAMDMQGTTRNLMGKYAGMIHEETTPTYVNRMRYAGAYFIAAEAYSRLGQDDEARSLVNHFLTLVGGTAIPETVTGTALTDSILHEKQLEFAGEGTRYFDLKRTRKAGLPRLARWGSSVSSTIDAGDHRWTWPIPRSEYLYNENVTQNEGWPLSRQDK